MINQYFKNKYKFLSDYFETLFNLKRRFPQSIVFEGIDTISQYFFTLELARIANCLENGATDCFCTNCKWIKENKHPSIINVTPLDFKEDATKTVISVKQIEKITSMINQASDYHRFFIFSNAKISSLNEIKEKKLEEYEKMGFVLENKEWQPYPLNRKILQEEASNALLKSTEEAPDKTTFVFLTDTKENIIETIVSRSLVFRTPSFCDKTAIDLGEFFENYPNLDIEKSIEKGSSLLLMAEDKNIDIIEVLDSMQEYLTSVLKTNLNLSSLILDDIQKIQMAKKQIMALVSPKYVIENLFVALSFEGRNV